MIDGNISEHYGFYCDIENSNNKYDIKYVLIYKNYQYNVVRKIDYSKNNKNNRQIDIDYYIITLKNKLYNNFGILYDTNIDIMEMHIEYDEKEEKINEINHNNKVCIVTFCVCVIFVFVCFII
jgi:hypothetical protein